MENTSTEQQTTTEPTPATTAPKRFPLLRRLLAALVIGVAVGTLIGLLFPRSYTATAVLQFPTASPVTTQGGGADKPALPLLSGVLSVPQPGTSPATAVLILTSHPVVARLVKQYGIKAEWRLTPEDNEAFFRRKFTCAAGANGELRITYTDRKRERTKKVIDESITLLTTTVEDLSLDPAARSVKFLANNLRESEQACDAAENSLIRFLKNYGGMPPDTQLQNLSTLSAELRREMHTAEVDQDAARAKLQESIRLYREMLTSAQAPAGGDALLPALYRTVVDREDALALLREKYTDKRPEVVQARQALDVARKRLATEIAHQTQSLRDGASPYVHDDLVAALAGQAKIDGFRHALASVSAQIATLPAGQTQYEQLKLTLADARAQLSVVRAEYVKAQIIAQNRGPQFVVLDPPAAPSHPNELSTRQFILFGALLAVLLVLLHAAGQWTKTFMQKLGL